MDFYLQTSRSRVPRCTGHVRDSLRNLSLNKNFMSRLIIKNLPGYITPEKLREHFQNKNGPGGIITDVKLLSKPDGTSRRFGFVGFKSDKEAAAAKDWFDRTFIGSTRINVSVVEVGFHFFYFSCIYCS